MNRSVRDLRDLICVSRLTCRESDDEDSPECDTAEKYNDDCSRSASRVSHDDSSRASSASSQNLQTRVSPASDSGIVTSADSPSESSASVVVADHLSSSVEPEDVSAKVASQKKHRRKVKKSKVSQPMAVQPELLKKFIPLPPVSAKKHNHKILNEPDKVVFKGNELISKMLQSADMETISDWLRQANLGISSVALWCSAGDNFVRFANFWLSMFSEQDRKNMFTLEYNLLLDQLTFVFDSINYKFTREDLGEFMTIVFREFPRKLLSVKGSFLFLDYLEILCERRDTFRRLLSDVKYSTNVKEHIQCILAIRSYAIISVWEAVVKFYQSLASSPDFLLQASLAKNTKISVESKGAVSQLSVRVEQCISLGFVDVLQYYLQSDRVETNYQDSHKRTLVFMAVMHSQPTVLRFLLSDVNIARWANLASDSGNTPLHAATNAGDFHLVSLLLSTPGIAVNVINKQCDGASPLHMAVMHGHAEIVKMLLAHGADVKALMGTMTALEIAEAFEHPDVAEMLR